MIANNSQIARNEFVVVHPMFDESEIKRTGEGLGRMRLSPAVRTSLLLLRAYLIAMGCLLAYHLFDLAGAFGHHVIK